MYLVPLSIVGFLTHSDHAIFLAFLLIIVGSGFLTFKSVELSEQGIHLHRWLGKQRVIDWADVEAVGTVDLWAMSKNSLWPFMGAHGFLGYSKDALRIETPKISLYLKPKDRAMFLDHVTLFSKRTNLVSPELLQPETPAHVPTGTLIFGWAPRQYLNTAPTILSLLFALFVVIEATRVFWTVILLISFPDIPEIDDRDLQVPTLSIPNEDNSFPAITQLGIKPLGKPLEDQVYTDVTMAFASWDGEVAEKYLTDTGASLDLFIKISDRPFNQDPALTDPKNFSIRSKVSDRLVDRDLAYYSALYARSLAVSGDSVAALNILNHDLDHADKMVAGNTSMMSVLQSVLIVAITTKAMHDLLGYSEIPTKDLLRTSSSIESYNNAKSGLRTAKKIEYMEMAKEIDGFIEGNTSFLDPISDETLKKKDRHPSDALAYKAIFKRNKTKKLFAERDRFFIHQIGRPCGKIESGASFEKEVEYKMRRAVWHPLEFASNIAGSLFTVLGLSFDGGLIERTCDNEFRLSSMQTLLAIKAFKNETGGYPPDLRSLVPNYLEEVPIDPYDHQPLKYDPDKLIIYSVGSDLRDSGGSEKIFPTDHLEPTITINF